MESLRLAGGFAAIETHRKTRPRATAPSARLHAVATPVIIWSWTPCYSAAIPHRNMLRCTLAACGRESSLSMNYASDQIRLGGLCSQDATHRTAGVI